MASLFFEVFEGKDEVCLDKLKMPNRIIIKPITIIEIKKYLNTLGIEKVNPSSSIFIKKIDNKRN